MEQKVQTLDNKIKKEDNAIKKTIENRIQILNNKFNKEMKNFQMKIITEHGCKGNFG